MGNDAAAVAEFSPATYHQYVSLLIERMAAETLPELAGMIRLKGRFNDPGAPKGSQFYGVKISDDGGAQAKADIPASLIQGRGVQVGQQIVLIGRIAIRSSQYGVEARLVATDVHLVEDAPAPTPDADQGKMTIERLRSMPVTRNSFPASLPASITVIQSSSAQARVAMDTQSELDKVSEALVVRPVAINMLDPVAIARAIRQSESGILMIIRGGGPAEDFAVFDDPRVVQSLAECRAHRVVGLGHSGNGCLLDLVADVAANTPGQAGCYVRETIEKRLCQRQEILRQGSEAKALISKLERERDEVKRLLTISSEKAFPPWLLLVAGAAVAWLFSWGWSWVN